MKIIRNLFIASLIIFTSNSFSQGFFKNLTDRLYFGVKAGANYSDFTNADFDTEGLMGFHAGGIIGYNINEHFSLQEEFLYSTQGAKIKGGLMDGQDIKLSYMAVPILIKYKTKSGLYLEAGPQVGILIDEDFKSLVISQYTKYAEKIDAGAAAGIGYQFQNGIGIGARYYMSFTDLSKNKTSGFNSDFQNNSAQLSLFYTF